MILDENLFQDYRKPLKESAEAVKRILQPRVTKHGIKPFGENERLPRGFRFKSSSGTNGEVTYNGRDYVYAIKNGEVRVMDSSKAGHNWSETIYKESINESKSIKEGYNGILTDEEEELLWDISNRYVTSHPISGRWENETQHELEAISDELNVSEEDAKSIMIDYLGFSEEQFNESKSINEDKSISLSEDQLDKAMELIDEIYEACKSIYSYNKNGKFEEGLSLNEWSIYSAAADLHDMLEGGSLTESTETDETPWSYKEVEDTLKSLSNNWRDKSGVCKCWHKEEKQYAVKILRKHYKTVEVSQDGDWTVIAFETPIQKESMLEDYLR